MGTESALRNTSAHTLLNLTLEVSGMSEAQRNEAPLGRRVRRRIKTWVRPLAKMPTWQAVCWVRECNPRTLRSAVAAMEACSQTNCWWGDYNTAQALLPIARERLPANAEVSR